MTIAAFCVPSVAGKYRLADGRAVADLLPAEDAAVLGPMDLRNDGFDLGRLFVRLVLGQRRTGDGERQRQRHDMEIPTFILIPSPNRRADHGAAGGQGKALSINDIIWAADDRLLGRRGFPALLRKHLRHGQRVEPIRIGPEGDAVGACRDRQIGEVDRHRPCGSGRYCSGCDDSSGTRPNTQPAKRR